MSKYNNLCNWQPKNCCLVKPPPPPGPPPVGCNQDVAEVYFTYTSANVFPNWSISNVTINTTTNCGYLDLPSIVIPNTNLTPKIGPLYFKFCTYDIMAKYFSIARPEYFICFNQTITIDKCYMEIPIDQNLNYCK